MIKVVSTHPVADIGWIGRGRRAKSGRLCNGQEKVWILSTFEQCLVPFKRGDWRKGVGARCRTITRVQPFAEGC